MGTRKKSTELVFNLQWRNKPDNGGDKSNVIGMYDTPTTTSNFNMFKSYLLKNSGVAGNDVKVTYCTDNGQEWVIDSQEWFEIALSSFRLKARLGEVISLKLDRISVGRNQASRNDVETQSDVDSLGFSVVAAPPEWFISYMKEFKRDLLEEVTFAVLANINRTDKEKENPPPIIIPHYRRMKFESSKRSRKHLSLGETPIDKEFIKTLKYDRKLENKLDKLDAKTKKIKEKKQALIGKMENEERRYFGKISVLPVDNEKAEAKRSDLEVSTPLMNACLVDPDQKHVLHMMGGEVYMHTWEVMNNGMMSWTPQTVLRLTWGSADLIPSVKVLTCPQLKPGEVGRISVRFEIPAKAGTYESYWNFYDKEVRFGNSLNCCFAVFVEHPLQPMSQLHFKTSPSQTETLIASGDSFPATELFTPTKENYQQLDEHMSKMAQMYYKGDLPLRKLSEIVQPKDDWRKEEEASMSSSVMDLSRRLDDIKLVQADSDSDWESVRSYGKLKMNESDLTTDSPRPSNKYGINENDLVVDLSVCVKREEPKEEEKQCDEDNNNNNNGILDNNNSDSSSEYDILNAPICEEKEDVSGYVYITIDGNKLPVPKHILRPDFLATAEVAPNPNEAEPKIETATEAGATAPESPQEPDKSHCSATGSSFSDATTGRLFIFPQNHPGYEVVTTTTPVEDKYIQRCDLFDMSRPRSDSQQSQATPVEDKYIQRCFFLDKPYQSQETTPAWLKGYEWPQPQEAVEQKRQEQATPQVFESPQPQEAIEHMKKRQEQAAPQCPQPQEKRQEQATAPEEVPVQGQEFQGVPVHILPENLVSGAVNVASSAINTARSVINMIVPSREPGRWVNGHWVTEDTQSIRAKNLCVLAEMGFWDMDLNATLLARYKDDVGRVVSELIQ